MVRDRFFKAASMGNTARARKRGFGLCAALALLTAPLFGAGLEGSVKQLIVSVAPGWDSTTGKLQLFERAGDGWKPAAPPVAVLYGKSGLVWGRGIYGQDEPGLNKVIHSAYNLLGLQSYLTAGEQEVRAWTIKKGMTAPQAAGVIHGDFERGFIAAQIIDYDDLISAGTEQSAKSSGKVRTEGKTYVMQPNDIVEFRFNV